MTNAEHASGNPYAWVARLETVDEEYPTGEDQRLLQVLDPDGEALTATVRFSYYPGKHWRRLAAYRFGNEVDVEGFSDPDPEVIASGEAKLTTLEAQLANQDVETQFTTVAALPPHQRGAAWMLGVLQLHPGDMEK